MPQEKKVALVTGAAKRVGRAIALALAEEGYYLVVHYGRSRKEAEETVDEIKHKGVEAIALSAARNPSNHTLPLSPRLTADC